MDKEQQISHFNKTVKDFYRVNKRNFPWRETDNPYHILISEVMLQQTQTYRVLPKYEEFLKKFPTFKHLAKAPQSKVLKVWSGLGYNRRAMYLQKTAQIIINQYNGKVPEDPKVLETLPGIGKATAASIAVFSHNTSHVFIETNIRRVFIHHFFTNPPNVIASAAKQSRPGSKIHSELVSDTEIAKLVEETLDTKNPREWYWALMDYGSKLGKKDNPNRRSKHYTKQSKFEGSVRKIRGEILKFLLTNTDVTSQTLQKHIGAESEKFEKALEGLKKDQLVKEKGRYITLL